jgi:hypothetical protein
MHNYELYEPYQQLTELYSSDIFIEEADFSERMLKLISRISERFQEKYGDGKEQYLSAGEVTNFIYQHNVPQLRKVILEYLQHKERVVILFDNIDKGWPTKGIEPIDILLVRALSDATRKIEREFHKQEIDFNSSVFLRSDVYELLLEETPDRGKETGISLNWTDPDLLREFLRRRIVYNDLDPKTKFDIAWHQICVSHIHGEDSADFVIGRSLMRPRNLLNLVNHCKSIAVNLQHPCITEEDILKALEVYSADISREIGLEIRDVFPEAEDILYYLIGVSGILTVGEIKKHISPLSTASDFIEHVIEILLWFGFLGVVTPDDQFVEGCYIYHVQYDLKKLKIMAQNLKDDNTKLCIHKAFWSFLGIQG